MDRVNICSVEIDNVTFKELLEFISDAVERKKNLYVVAPNVDHIVNLQNDEDFRRVYREAALVLADGMPLLWAANYLGTPLKEKISGSDLVPLVCALAAEKGYSLFFLGGRPGASKLAKEKMEKKYPGLVVRGEYSPPFGFEKDPEEQKKIISMIRRAAPDILFVGLGAPKQEKWINAHYRQAGVPFSMGVGVSFEFMAGLVKRAPRFMQKTGFEWLWRLIMEPKRLWRRYLVNDMRFFKMVIDHRSEQRRKG